MCRRAQAHTWWESRGSQQVHTTCEPEPPPYLCPSVVPRGGYNEAKSVNTPLPPLRENVYIRHVMCLIIAASGPEIPGRCAVQLPLAPTAH